MNFNKISDGFGERFKAILKEKGVSQSKFGDDTDTHKGLISRYINGESPSGDFIMKAVSYFPNNINYLFFGDSTDSVQEEGESYARNPEDIISSIEVQLAELKRCLSQK